MKQLENKNPDIEREFRQFEHVYNTYFNAKITESNRYPLDDPRRVEADLSELEKAHLNLLQSKLSATIAQEKLKGMARSASENASFSNKLLFLNILIVIATITYTWITWWSASAVREGNEIQRQIYLFQKPK
ncbi:hypothetical protein [Geothrix sp.]|jgi:hypothetical protein|uniref:hypothetical protein n=1 Tax=Geothrix sp. TaxID=1962974 RepID=UPI0025BF7296|nr:hypothetical protein [Geothrix sp.]